MTTRTLTALAALAAMPAPAALAKAPQLTVPNPVIRGALNRAATYWGENAFERNNSMVYPCKRLIVRADEPDGGTEVGYQTWSPLGSSTCVIGVSVAYQTAEGARAGWQNLCMVMIHEYGHALGYRHSGDPTSIMYPTAGQAPVPRVCQ